MPKRTEIEKPIWIPVAVHKKSKMAAARLGITLQKWAAKSLNACADITMKDLNGDKETACGRKAE